MKIDERSAKNIATLAPKARPWFEEFYRQANEYAASHNLLVVITSGNRTWAEQDELYAQGRSKPGNRVTNARGGQSNHNYRIAVDVTLFKGNSPVWESPHYARLGMIGKKLGLEWGGSWTTIKDEPHFQIRVGRTTGQLRALVNNEGWGAIDALIPTYKGASEPAAPPAPVTALLPVSVAYDDPDDTKPAVELSVRAWLLSAKTYVSGEDLCDYFGGTFAVVEDTDGGVAEITLNGERRSLAWKALEGVRCVRYSDAAGILGLTHSWDGKTRTLTVHRDKEGKEQ